MQVFKIVQKQDRVDKTCPADMVAFVNANNYSAAIDAVIGDGERKRTNTFSWHQYGSIMSWLMIRLFNLKKIEKHYMSGRIDL